MILNPYYIFPCSRNNILALMYVMLQLLQLLCLSCMIPNMKAWNIKNFLPNTPVNVWQLRHFCCIDSRSLEDWRWIQIRKYSDDGLVSWHDWSDLPEQHHHFIYLQAWNQPSWASELARTLLQMTGHPFRDEGGRMHNAEDRGEDEGALCALQRG